MWGPKTYGTACDAILADSQQHLSIASAPTQEIGDMLYCSVYAAEEQQGLLAAWV